VGGATGTKAGANGATGTRAGAAAEGGTRACNKAGTRAGIREICEEKPDRLKTPQGRLLLLLSAA